MLGRAHNEIGRVFVLFNWWRIIVVNKDKLLKNRGFENHKIKLVIKYESYSTVSLAFGHCSTLKGQHNGFLKAILELLVYATQKIKHCGPHKMLFQVKIGLFLCVLDTVHIKKYSYFSPLMNILFNENMFNSNDFINRAF